MSGRRPDDLAVEDGLARRTWGELEERTRAIAHGLSQQVPGVGRHVALIATNRVEFIEVALACLRAGLVYTPLKSSWTPSEIDAVLTDASTCVVVTDVPAGRQAGDAAGLSVIDLDQDFDSWVAAQSLAPLPYELAGRKITYTSGTTGRPKGVVSNYLGQRPFAESFAGSAAMAELTGLPGHGVHLFVSHLFHGAPLTFGLGALARGATVRIVPRWDPETVLALLVRRGDVDVHGAHHVPSAPPIARRGPCRVRRAAVGQRPPWRRAMPGPGEAGHARMVGPPTHRVLRLLRGGHDDRHE